MKGQFLKKSFSGKDGSREKNDVRVLLEKVVWVGVKGNAEVVSEVGVVSSGVGEESVVVAEESFG